MSPATKESAAQASLSFVSPIYSSVLVQGWLLKKRRKKLQGFARRYFTLYASGLLSYSFEPGQQIRDSISIQASAIATAPGRKDIHIDSSNATFHVKALTTQDFDIWMSAFRKFITPVQDSRRSASVRMASRRGSLKLNRPVATAEQMSTTIGELEQAFLSLKKEPPRKSSASLKPKLDKDKEKSKESVFGLFKRSSGSHQTLQTDSSATLEPADTAYERIQTLLELLKTQHTTLLKSVQSLQTITPLDLSQSTITSPLPITEEDENAETASALSAIGSPARRSIATVSDISDWFDASDALDDGAQEFLLDEGEQPSKLLSLNESQSSLGGGDSSDTDIEEEPTAQSQHAADDGPPEPAVRRTHLPSPAGDEGSLFAVLKKNVGKDLSSIPLPANFNEPLTLLQRQAEEMEYHDLLERAASTDDAIERIQLVAAFVVSTHAHTRHRSGRKGFNPMLAETFEYKEKGMSFLAEKVRHNPMVELAYYAQGPQWELHGVSRAKSKFWGKSLEVIPTGSTSLKMGDDEFRWNKPSTFVRNLLIGSKYLEHVGIVNVENVAQQTRCVLEFKANSGYFGGSSNVVSGVIYDSSGPVAQMEGKWDEKFCEKVDSSTLRVLWTVAPWPQHTQLYYGLTSFAISLNELTDGLRAKLPSTDSRFRTDVRALENGELPLADEEKLRIEDTQRQRRSAGTERNPRWFQLVEGEWRYVGGYWEARQQGWKEDSPEPLW